MSMVSHGYKNFYVLELPNKKNVIYELINECFKETDIVSIQYTQKFSKETSRALLSV